MMSMPNERKTIQEPGAKNMRYSTNERFEILHPYTPTVAYILIFLLSRQCREGSVDFLHGWS